MRIEFDYDRIWDILNKGPELKPLEAAFLEMAKSQGESWKGKSSYLDQVSKEVNIRGQEILLPKPLKRIIPYLSGHKDDLNLSLRVKCELGFVDGTVDRETSRLVQENLGSRFCARDNEKVQGYIVQGEKPLASILYNNGAEFYEVSIGSRNATAKIGTGDHPDILRDVLNPLTVLTNQLINAYIDAQVKSNPKVISKNPDLELLISI